MPTHRRSNHRTSVARFGRRLSSYALAGFIGATACYETQLIDDPSEGNGSEFGGAAGDAVEGPSDAGTGGENPSPNGGAPDPGKGDAGATGDGATGDGGQNTTGGRAPGGGLAGFGGRAPTGGASPSGGSGGTTGGRIATTGGTGGGANGGTTTGGAGASTGGSTPLPGVTWFTFDDSTAPAELEPNGELDINGALYAYGDDCATYAFDPLTRCMSGTLCAAGPSFENWGVAVGFYFKTTGASGDPPNLKSTWDPSEIGADGIAWRITGTAPALQLWVLNMDPAYGGECAEDSCEIIGPPDGNASLALAGTLSFGTLYKDDWNGSGINYEFDPAAIHALQFKLPAIIAGAATFSFCIEELGIVR